MTTLDDDLDRAILPPGAWWVDDEWAPIDQPRSAQPSAPAYRTAEQHEILGAFLDLLAGPTGDGAVKRDRGEKTLWKYDTTHRDALLRHLTRAIEGETYDEDSGCPTWSHIAWRACALAYQQLDRDGLIR